MKMLFGRRSHGEALKVALDLGEPVMYWPYGPFGPTFKAEATKKTRRKPRPLRL